MLRPSLLAIALALIPTAPAPAREAGPVVLLGERAQAGAVPEIVRAEGSAVILSPYPNLDSSNLARQLVGRAEAESLIVRPGDSERANERALAEAVRGAGVIGLWGGDQHDWYDIFWPGGDRSRLLTALLEAHHTGATVVGQGPSVAFLSAASVWDGSQPTHPPLRRPSTPPHDQGEPVLAWNLGLQPWAAVDTEARSQGSPWDLIDLLVDERLRLGLYLEDQSALVFDPAAPELRVRGTGAVWIFDLRNARRGKRWLKDARFSVLLEGDSWSRRERAVRSPGTPAEPFQGRETIVGEGGVLLSRQPEAGECFPSLDPGPPIVMSAGGTQPLVLDGRRGEGRKARLVLTPDEDSAAWTHPRRPRVATLANLRLDLEWDLE